jgi:hypothetical protein
MNEIFTNTKKYLSGPMYLFLILMVIPFAGFSQSFGINTTSSLPDASSGIDVDIATKGLLIPRIALTNSSSSAPLLNHIAGMLVYNTATAGDVIPGFYLDNGSNWVVNTTTGNAAGDMQYWNGSAWGIIPAGQSGQFLQINGSGIPAWSGVGSATLTTTAASSITATSAVSGGNITSDGGTLITVFGVCWSTSPNPTTALSTKTIGISGGPGSFVSNLTGLTTGTTYYVRAYATNLSGTAYGNEISFTTL